MLSISPVSDPNKNKKQTKYRYKLDEDYWMVSMCECEPRNDKYMYFLAKASKQRRKIKSRSGVSKLITFICCNKL